MRGGWAVGGEGRWVMLLENFGGRMGVVVALC